MSLEIRVRYELIICRFETYSNKNKILNIVQNDNEETNMKITVIGTGYVILVFRELKLTIQKSI